MSGTTNFYTSAMTSSYQDVIVASTGEAVLARVAKVNTGKL